MEEQWAIILVTTLRTGIATPVTHGEAGGGAEGALGVVGSLESAGERHGRDRLL